MEVTLKAKGSDAKARLQLTTTRKGILWFDQLSLMPTDTYKVCIPNIKFPFITYHLNDGLLCNIKTPSCQELDTVMVFPFLTAHNNLSVIKP